jgi:polyphosphate kinase
MDLKDPSLYLNRELSQLEFNSRVLAQAEDERMPLLERVRFLCITSSNLDEFFEIRVANIRFQLSQQTPRPWPDGRSTTEVLAEIQERVQALVQRQYRCWTESLVPAMRAEGINFLARDSWTQRQRRWLHAYFQSEVQPVLSPLGLDPAHPFPRLLNKSLNFAVQLKGKDAFGREGHLALVRAPRSLPRVIRLPKEVSQSPYEFTLLSSIMQTFVAELFPGMEVTGAYAFRVTRNGELTVDEQDVENLAHALQDELHERGFADAVRLEIAEGCPKPLVKFLAREFVLTDDDVYRVPPPVNLGRVQAVYDMIDRPSLKFRPHKPRVQPALSGSILDTVRGGDVLLHHPFESFSTVVDLLRQAAADPNVLAIKQTLYRAGRNSPLVGALIEAARAGKDVTVVIELRARFDEEANIGLANRLQEAGVQVVYGVVGYKTHAKMVLIVRREGGKLRRYVHLGTGNYHPGNATVYTDFGLLTCDRDIGEDAHKVFQQLSGFSSAYPLKQLLLSPFTQHREVLQRIEREIANARAGKPARIIAKMNALQEVTVIQSLYRASQAGVEIDLIIRGACVLKPGVPGVSERIRVRSIIGRFLEHTRVYCFENAGKRELWCSSADWMDRNLLRRVEISFPILDPALRERVFKEGLEPYLADNVSAWQLSSDGRYTRIEPGEQMPYSAQDSLLAQLCSDEG